MEIAHIEVPEQLGDEENQDVNGNTNIESAQNELGDEEKSRCHMEILILMRCQNS